MLKANKLAVVFIGLLFGYYEIYRWVPLGAWNGEFYWPVKNDQFYPDIVIGVLLLWMLSVFWRQRVVGMWIAVSLLMLWIGVHLVDWWIPYLDGTGPEREGFYRFYSSRTQVLPVIGSHHPPDGGHTVLDVFVLLAFISSSSAVFAKCNKGKWAPRS
jgi:hypothetical protein